MSAVGPSVCLITLNDGTSLDKQVGTSFPEKAFSGILCMRIAAGWELRGSPNMQLPINISGTASSSLQEQLTAQIHGLITRGVLLPGRRLPSTRELAEQLGISRRTVVLSYERLLDVGVLETRPALGTFVSGQLPSECIRVEKSSVLKGEAEPAPPTPDRSFPKMDLYQSPTEAPMLDFRIGRPDFHLFPVRTWRRLTSEYLDTLSKFVSDYGDPAGHPLLRSAVASHLRVARGMICRPEQVIITAGAQDGLNLVPRLMGIAGRRVVMEDPCYRGAAFAFTSLGAELFPVGVRHDGLDTDDLPEEGARLAYVTPSHQFPLGVTMSAERRSSLVSWARKTGTLIVEDDYDSDFRHNSSPLIALQALAPVVYLGTFSKSIGPGLRLGYAVVPNHLVESAAALKSIMSNGHPWLEQAVTAQFISSGCFEQHLGRMRARYLERRDALMVDLKRNFPSTGISGFEGGMHLVWELDSGFPDALSLESECRKKGVGIYTLTTGPTVQIERRPKNDCKIMLGYPSLDRRQIHEAVDRIRAAADRLLARAETN